LLFLTYELISKHSSVTIPSERFVEALEQLIQLGTVIQENDRIYLPSLYASEVGIATHFERALSGEVKEVFPQAAVTSAIGKVEERLGVNYARSQIEAIEQAIHSPLMILTGGPGTGKTTVIQGIVEVFAELRGYSLDPSTYVGKDEGFPIVLAAPTGRAAKRMNESTGLPAMTIHRLLGFTGQEEEDDFEGREVSGELIIIDEMSMVDNWLAYQLMKAIPKDAQLLLVGDEDQLPSVGPGQVLKDLIASRELPVIELTEIFRQSEDSSIIQLAHQMKTDRPILDLTAKKKDRSFIPAESYQVPKVVEQIVTSAIEKGFSIQEIQVLAPMYRGEAGINRLNQQIQDAVNPKSERARELQFGETVYRVGDKVLQLVNQPESNVFNGDIGEIVAIFYANENVDKKDQLVVQFDQNEVVYEKRDLNQLTLAYCTSIHKAQGSEFSLVIMPIVRGFQKMLRKNLLYTGITRAKRFLIMVGEEYAWTTGLTRSDELNRYTTLKERLAGTLYDDMPTVSNEGEEETSFVLQMNQLYTIDPMIGMEGVTPFDFLEK
ncbi:MAG TPA: ATP-dependent RecD-like DNA helicase, partial [Savagea sp.]